MHILWEYLSQSNIIKINFSAITMYINKKHPTIRYTDRSYARLEMLILFLRQPPETPPSSMTEESHLRSWNTRHNVGIWCPMLRIGNPPNHQIQVIFTDAVLNEQIRALNLQNGNVFGNIFHKTVMISRYLNKQ